MKRFTFILFLLLTNLAYAQKKFSATVYDADTRKPLAGTQVVFFANNEVLITNEQGKLSYEMQQTPDSVSFSYIGYKDTVIFVSKPSTKIVIRLQPIAFQTEEVVVTSKKKDENIRLEREEVFLSKAELQSLPALMGEQDIIRSFTVNAGIQQFEGMQGIYVRGGGQDQNLIIFDNAIVYNPSHLLGFFSVFSPDIIENAKLYKSGMPAKYGGRLSSVLQINSQRPSSERFEFDGSIGLISSRLKCNIPIGEKFATSLSLRKSYLNAMVLPMVYAVCFPNDNVPVLGFSDVNAKLSYVANPRNSFFISAYMGKDDFALQKKRIASDENCVQWGNAAISANWTHTSKNNFITSTSTSYSTYAFQFNTTETYYSLSTETGISNLNIHSVTNKQLGNHLVSFGAENLTQFYNIGTINLQTDSVSRNISNPDACNSNESTVFAEDNITLSDKCNIVIGLRGTLYSKKDSLSYWRPEINPRLQFRYLFSSASSVKASVSKETQNLHLVSLISSALPADIWFPATCQQKPEQGLLYSVGYFHNFLSNTFETSISFFGKHMKNLMEFKSNSLDFYTHNFYDKITSGKGMAFGTELSVAKKQGQFQWSASYSFSRTLRKCADINDNYWYPAPHDRPHDATLSMTYATKSKKWKFSAYWIFTSGKPYSEISDMYLIAGNLVHNYGATNNSRMPAYHRLDLSADYQWTIKDMFDAHLLFSMYNAYNRMNPYFITYDADYSENTQSYSLVKETTGLFPILPSVSLSLHLL